MPAVRYVNFSLILAIPLPYCYVLLLVETVSLDIKVLLLFSLITIECSGSVLVFHFL